jgi:NitT/TauT family transport system substrate-binding protein
MQIDKRSLLKLAAGGAAFGALAMPAVPARAANDKIRMGYIADYSGTSVAAIATAKGLWAKHGLDADLKVFTNGPIQVQALGAGSLDFAYIGPGALWLPASGHAKIISVNVIGDTDRVIAQPAFKLFPNLKGKKVAVPEGTSGDMLLRLALKKYGMTQADIQIVKMDPSTIVTAMASRQVDAAGIWYPFVEVIRKQIPDLVELAANNDFFPDVAFPSSFIVGDAMAGNTAVVKKVIAVIKEASDYRLNNLPEAVEITAKFLGVPAEPLKVEAVKAVMPTSKELEKLTREGKVGAWFDTLASLYVDFGKIKDPLPASKFYLGDLYAGD